MKIRYNIAKNKEINYRRFFLLTGILTVITIGFILVGAKALSTSAKQFQNKKNELKICQEAKQEKSKKNKEHKTEIENIMKKWRNKRDFANRLVNNKTFPFLEKLNRFEELLPAGVYIRDITLSADSGTKIQFSLAAISSSKLLEAFRAFIKYNLVIKKEDPKDGLYYADMQIILGSGK